MDSAVFLTFFWTAIASLDTKFVLLKKLENYSTFKHTGSMQKKLMFELVLVCEFALSTEPE
jgi:hypothetical protein